MSLIRAHSVGEMLISFLPGLVALGMVPLGMFSPQETLGFIAPGMIGIGGVVASLVGLSMPRLNFRRLHLPVSIGEVDLMTSASRDDLEQAFLSVVLAANSLEVPDDVAKDVRSALRVLGDAIDELPKIPCDLANIDVLRAKAREVRDTIRPGTDTRLSASLERQADALQHSADLAFRSQRSLARSNTFREELKAQINALHLGLMGFGDPASNAENLALLAESVRSVATGASSQSAARVELDEALKVVVAEPVTKSDSEPNKRLTLQR